jgi:hypothetical protein
MYDALEQWFEVSIGYTPPMYEDAPATGYSFQFGAHFAAGLQGFDERIERQAEKRLVRMVALPCAGDSLCSSDEI